MKCPYQSEIGCSKFDLLPCVGVNNCVFINGSNNLLQGIQTPYEELKAQKEKAESELKAINDRIEAVTEEDILEIIEEQDEKYMNCLTADEHIAKAIIEKLKQIGGVK